MTTAEGLLDVGILGAAGQASEADLGGYDGGLGPRGWMLSGVAAVLLHAAVVGPFLVRGEEPPAPPVAPPAIEIDLMPAAAPVEPATPPPAAQPIQPEIQPLAEIPPEPIVEPIPEPVEPDPVETVEEVVPDEPLIPDDLPVVAAAPVEVAVAKPVARPRPPRPRVETPRPPRPEPPPPVTRSIAPAPPTPTPTPPSPVAPAQAAAPAAPAAPPAPPPNAMPNFQGILVAHLKRHQRYPRQAQRRREEGSPQVRIVMTADGAVVSAALVRSSGHESLDEEAVALVRRAEPLPQIPPELNRSRLEVIVPINFNLR